MWQEAALAYTAALAVAPLREKHRTPQTQVVLKNAVFVIGELVLRAHVVHLALQTENAIPAVTS